jgi:hypothetical protein
LKDNYNYSKFNTYRPATSGSTNPWEQPLVRPAPRRHRIDNCDLVPSDLLQSTTTYAPTRDPTTIYKHWLLSQKTEILPHRISDMAAPRPRMHARSPTFPLYHSTRKKPRRWPLVLRFIKGAIHVDIAMPVVLHAAWSALIVYIDQVREDHIGLPSSIIPSLSIVVGLMLVFRNSTSYDRFWQVRHPQTCEPLDSC